jgi:hypothetical protein
MDNNRFVEGEIQIHMEARCIFFPSLLAMQYDVVHKIEIFWKLLVCVF